LRNECRDAAGVGAVLEPFCRFVEEFLGTPESEQMFPELRQTDRAVWSRIVAELGAGKLVEAGTLPQVELALLGALLFVVAGKRVFFFSGLPSDFAVLGRLLEFGRDTLKVKLGTATVADRRSQDEAATEKVYDNELVVCEFPAFLEAYHQDRDLVKERPSVAVCCEAELCLYDARLAMFAGKTLRALAAVYHHTGKKASWAEAETGDTLDLRVIVRDFERVCGVSSYIGADVRAELKQVYADSLAEVVRARKHGPGFRHLVFKTRREKHEMLSRQAHEAEGDVLIFHYAEETRNALSERLKSAGEKVMDISNPRELIDFLRMSGTQKRVGLYYGIPPVLAQVLPERPAVTAFLAEHLLFPHHHGKILAFLHRNTVARSRPTLCFSLEDPLFGLTEKRSDFATHFELIRFTEKWDKHRQVRRVMARSIMATLRRVHRAALNEESPVFTVVLGGQPKPKKSSKVKKTIGRQLGGLCFCGSGKPFRECHGKRK